MTQLQCDIPQRAERIRVRGLVQGVGFRPFVHRLAHGLGLSGEVWNDAEGVLIHVAGEAAAVEELVGAIAAEAPALARVTAIERSAWLPPPALAAGFRIAASAGGRRTAGVVPDARLCAACAAEIADPAERRYRYAFSSCTACGPRFSIIAAIPYDRPNTTMRGFPMCAACRAEYENSTDRRFHAQPIACPSCGPQAWLETPTGDSVPVEDPLAAVVTALRNGAILGIKGLGGFHLACDARNETAVVALRHRKRRPAKPFALMAPDLDGIHRFCVITREEAALLASPAAPIVLLRHTGPATLAASVAPGQTTLGWMLPTTPLHQILLQDFSGPLVMTSGNVSGEPQETDNETARARLGGFVDLFLMHNRPIARRLDDSVARVVHRQARLLRHARGYAPAPRALPPGFVDTPAVLATGGEMKSAICLLHNGQALLSHHLGDLEDAATFHEFKKAITDYTALFDHTPACIACDLHPDYRSTSWAEAEATSRGLPLLHVQHHHAHIAAVMAERMWPRDGGKVVGIALDGLGHGTDGTVWGGEVLLCDYAGFQRMARLRPVPLPGGARAVTEPWRNLIAQLDTAFGPEDANARLSIMPGGEKLHGKPLGLLRQAMARRINTPLSSSCGRLFDAVAAALGIAPDRMSFEGEAAMALEALVTPGVEAEPYPFALNETVEPWAIDPEPMWAALLADLEAGVSASVVAARLHAGLTEAFCSTALRIAEGHNAMAVVLAGGVFQNALLLDACLIRLGAAGVTVLAPAEVPAGDGGLAYGQAVVAAAIS
ncbi:carbamoyltransferase HypF (plasmid) [Rhodovastum atsumiense]|nr:carbamoyltransferase HypF [Rhodovastum atsumiense]CAH2605553.1 carbamoyltransferase HypF [Rhodovastum atsumiense]